MSLYALSLFTQRQLLIEIQKPCNFIQMMVPNRVNWNPEDYKLDGKSMHMKCMENQDCITYFDDIIESSENQLSNDILSFNVNLDWLTYFSKNPKYKTRIEKLGYSPERFQLVHLFKEWYNTLFKFSPDFQSKYELIKAKIDKKTLICAQIRIGGERFREMPFNSFNVTKYFWQFVRQNFLKDLPEKTWKLVVMTEMIEVEKEAVDEFGEENMIQIPGEFSHSDRLIEYSNDCRKVEKSILEFNFMEYCDKAVVSDSGFGKIGVWNRDQPTKDTFLYQDQKFKPMTYETSSAG